MTAQWFRLVAPVPAIPPATVLVIRGRIAGGAGGGWGKFEFRFGREWEQLRELLIQAGCSVQELPNAEPEFADVDAVLAGK